MAIYTSKTRIDLEDVGYSNKITNKAILKILENAGARQSETIHFGLNDMGNVGFSWILLGWKVALLPLPGILPGKEVFQSRRLWLSGARSALQSGYPSSPRRS